MVLIQSWSATDRVIRTLMAPWAWALGSRCLRSAKQVPDPLLLLVQPVVGVGAWYQPLDLVQLLQDPCVLGAVGHLLRDSGPGWPVRALTPHHACIEGGQGWAGVGQNRANKQISKEAKKQRSEIGWEASLRERRTCCARGRAQGRGAGQTEIWV